MPSESFGVWLQYQLDRREWSQSDLSARSGLSTGLISNYINGVRHPSPQSVDRIADALMIDVDEVLTRAGRDSGAGAFATWQSGAASIARRTPGHRSAAAEGSCRFGLGSTRPRGPFRAMGSVPPS